MQKVKFLNIKTYVDTIQKLTRILLSGYKYYQ